MSKLTFLARAAALSAAAVVSTAALTGLAACQLDMAPRPATGCVIPGTHTTVPSESGARFGGKPHSCVRGHWQAFSATENAR